MDAVLGFREHGQMFRRSKKETDGEVDTSIPTNTRACFTEHNLFAMLCAECLLCIVSLEAGLSIACFYFHKFTKFLKKIIVSHRRYFGTCHLVWLVGFDISFPISLWVFFIFPLRPDEAQLEHSSHSQYPAIIVTQA